MMAMDAVVASLAQWSNSVPIIEFMKVDFPALMVAHTMTFNGFFWFFDNVLRSFFLDEIFMSYVFFLLEYAASWL